MPQLSLSLLGPLHIALGEATLTRFESNKVRALLVYLCVEADRAHRRESLAGLLWPEQPDRVALHSLSQALSNLRVILGDRSAAVPFVLITPTTLQFNRASDYWLDVALFSDLAAACRSHTHRRADTCLSCMQRSTRIAELYRGGFLEHLSINDSSAFEDWALVIRERIAQSVLEILECLVEYHGRRGAYDLVHRYAARQLELEPWREQAQRQLLRALSLAGQRATAVAQYHRWRTRLFEELGLEPEDATVALFDRLRQGEIVDAWADAGSATNLRPFAPLGGFIGREAELLQIAERLQTRGCRLLTLVGPGGVGKTRLALQAAAEQIGNFRDGVYFVPLAPLASAEFLIAAIADALAFVVHGVDEPLPQLMRYLADRELLLVLDNFEHVLDGVGLLLEILRQAPAVTVLVTSREPLNLQSEWLLDIQGLAYPQVADTHHWHSYGAVQLFAQTAVRLQADFALTDDIAPSVTQICRLVEGLPLAIELAAAWIRKQTCAAIARDIACSLDLFATSMQDVPERHRSMRVVFDHSWALLSDTERQVFRRLSVFRGGLTIAAAAFVAEASMVDLAALGDKSLLRQVSNGRYELHELIRQYGREQLEASGELAWTQQRHLAYFLDLAVVAEPHLHGAEQHTWLAQMDVEHDNLRAALTWAQTNDLETGAQLVGRLGWYWFVRGQISEGRTWHEDALIRGASVSIASRAKILRGIGIFARHQGDLVTLRMRAEASLALFQAVDDKGGCAWALRNLGYVALEHGDLERAAHYCELSLLVCRELGAPSDIANALHTLADVLRERRDYERANMLLAEAVALRRQLGDTRGVAFAMNGLGDVAREQGAHAHAIHLYAESLLLFGQIAEQGGLAWPHYNLGLVALAQGDYEQAATHYGTSLQLSRALGDQAFVARALKALGDLAVAQADSQQAEPHYQAALELFWELRNRREVVACLMRLALVASKQERHIRAVRLWGAAAAEEKAIGVPLSAVERERYESPLGVLRASLGDHVFERTWAEGCAMLTAQAIVYALAGELPGA